MRENNEKQQKNPIINFQHNKIDMQINKYVFAM